MTGLDRGYAWVELAWNWPKKVLIPEMQAMLLGPSCAKRE